jgi:hypothetical protein
MVTSALDLEPFTSVFDTPPDCISSEYDDKRLAVFSQRQRALQVAANIEAQSTPKETKNSYRDSDPFDYDDDDDNDKESSPLATSPVQSCSSDISLDVNLKSIEVAQGQRYEKQGPGVKRTSITSQVATSFLGTCGLVSHQLESYEHFLHNIVSDIITESSPIVITADKHKLVHKIYFQDVKILKPTIVEQNREVRYLTPTEAHLMKQTYSIDVYVDVIHHVFAQNPISPKKYKLQSIKVYKSILISKIPCMRGSSACNEYHDINADFKKFGTFIINGYEKVVITQENLRCDFPYVSRDTKNSKYTHRCEILFMSIRFDQHQH